MMNRNWNLVKFLISSGCKLDMKWGVSKQASKQACLRFVSQVKAITETNANGSSSISNAVV